MEAKKRRRGRVDLSGGGGVELAILIIKMDFHIEWVDDGILPLDSGVMLGKIRTQFFILHCTSIFRQPFAKRVERSTLKENTLRVRENIVNRV